MRMAARVSGAEAENEPPAADLIDRLHGLGCDARVTVESGQDPRADLDSRGRGRNGAGHRDALPEPLRVTIRWPPEKLVARPDDVEPDLLGSQREVPDVRPPRHRTAAEHFPHRENEADLERAHRSSVGDWAVSVGHDRQPPTTCSVD